jgi:hypothetical protein
VKPVGSRASSGSTGGVVLGLVLLGIGATVFAQPFEVLAMAQLVQWIGLCAIGSGLLAGLITVSGPGATAARS